MDITIKRIIILLVVAFLSASVLWSDGALPSLSQSKRIGKKSEESG